VEKCWNNEKSFNLHLTLTLTGPLHHDHDHHEDQVHHNANPDRCDGIEFNAIGITCGRASLVQLRSDDCHHLGHVDAAFRMHNKEKSHRPFPGTVNISDVVDIHVNRKCVMDIKFPSLGVSCLAYVFSLTGEEVYNYDIATESVKERQWAHLPNCTSAFRWLEQYNCFYGHNFTRLHSVSGEVNGVYPKDARHYFMTCPNFTFVFNCAHNSHKTVSHFHLRPTSSGRIYMHLDTHNDGKHAFPIARTWKEVANGVDAVFSYSDKIYIIKGNQVYIYKSAAPSTLIEGYPKSLNEELGIEGPVNAAFVCTTCITLDGGTLTDLSATSRAIARETPLPISSIKECVCSLHQSTPSLLAFSRIRPEPNKIPPDMMGCVE
uniref:Hemopexin n=1 Tax=Oncorhynchus kisutch TaxID=8019 RepID=A0A8C7M617_ONCKI